MTYLENIFFSNDKNVDYGVTNIIEIKDFLEKTILDLKNKNAKNHIILISFLTTNYTIETHVVKFIIGKPSIKNILDSFFNNSYIPNNCNNCHNIIKIIAKDKKAYIYVR